jgi:polyisoprenyl-phosphate glycosyltransferase
LPNQKISIIIPSFNEVSNIKPLYDDILLAISAKEEYSFEFIFIDDGSEDETLNAIKNLAIADKRVFFIELSRNFGHQYAIKAGLDLSTGDAIITMDCDLQHPPAVINDLIKKWKEGYDIVYTRRKDDQKISWIKRTTSAIFYKFLNWASDLNLDKGTADFRLINRNVINAFKGFKENELFLRGLVKWAGFRQTAVDYKAHHRFSGKSKYSFKKMLSFAFRGITAFSIRPLKLVAFVGLVMFIVSLILIPYALISYFLGQTVPGWTSLIISIIFFGSLQLFMLGIIGLYLSKLAIQSKQRPQYLIRDTNYSTKSRHESIG